MTVWQIMSFSDKSWVLHLYWSPVARVISSERHCRTPMTVTNHEFHTCTDHQSLGSFQVSDSVTHPWLCDRSWFSHLYRSPIARVVPGERQCGTPMTMWWIVFPGGQSLALLLVSALYQLFPSLTAPVSIRNCAFSTPCNSWIVCCNHRQPFRLPRSCANENSVTVLAHGVLNLGSVRLLFSCCFDWKMPHQSFFLRRKYSA